MLESVIMLSAKPNQRAVRFLRICLTVTGVALAPFNSESSSLSTSKLLLRSTPTPSIVSVEPLRTFSNQREYISSAAVTSTPPICAISSTIDIALASNNILRYHSCRMAHHRERTDIRKCDSSFSYKSVVYNFIYLGNHSLLPTLVLLFQLISIKPIGI